MKQYKQKNTHYGNFTDTNKYYTINYMFHGLFISFSISKYIYNFKGYANMDNQYSHWLENKTFFRYYL